MCGRTACTLEPEDICRACSFQNNGKWKPPKWKEAPNDRNYYPSHNIPPTLHTPIMISSKHVDKMSNNEDGSYTVQPMYWGMVPFWHKGPLNKVGLSTNNAKLETILQKPMFKVPLKKGQRCVVLADGYYEWQTSKAGRQPYFIYFPQLEGIKIENQEWKENKFWDEEQGWLGPRILTMAGIFDVWNNPEDNSELFSYSIITMDASSAVDMVHERMPAILDDKEIVKKWLDYENVSMEEALKLLVPSTNLKMYPVTKDVGNSRYKSSDCNKPVDLSKSDICKSGKLMMDWLKKGSPTKTPKVEIDETISEKNKKNPSSSKDDASSPASKKIKIEKC